MIRTSPDEDAHAAVDVLRVGAGLAALSRELAPPPRRSSAPRAAAPGSRRRTDRLSAARPLCWEVSERSLGWLYGSAFGPSTAAKASAERSTTSQRRTCLPRRAPSASRPTLPSPRPRVPRGARVPGAGRGAGIPRLDLPDADVLGSPRPRAGEGRGGLPAGSARRGARSPAGAARPLRGRVGGRPRGVDGRRHPLRGVDRWSASRIRPCRAKERGRPPRERPVSLAFFVSDGEGRAG